MRVHVFLDTQLWIHFRPVEEVDWTLEVARASEGVRLVVSPILVRELDKLKSSASSRRCRGRATRALHQIEEWAQSGEVTLRSGVTIVYWAPPRALNLESLGLDPNWQDDVLLATAHAYQEAHPSERVVVISDDTGPRLKAPSLGIEAAPPPERARLEGEIDPVERENRDLRRQLERATHRLPRLRVRFQGGADSGKRHELPPLVAPTVNREAFVVEALHHGYALAPHHPRPSVSPPTTDGPGTRSSARSLNRDALAQAAAKISIPSAEYERYAEERGKYLQTVAAIAGRQWDVLERRGRAGVVTLELVNEGTAPAEDIDITVHVPDGPEVLADEDEEPPSLPEPPRLPRTHHQQMLDGLSLATNLSPFLPPSLDYLRDVGAPPANVSAPKIRKTNSYDVSYQIRRLKQHNVASLQKLVLLFPSLTEARSLTLACRIISASLPDPQESELHLVVPGASRPR